MASKAQTWLEFIIISAVFLSLIITISIFIFDKAQAQINDSKLQLNCEKVKAIEYSLYYPGSRDSATIKTLGLGTAQSDAIDFEKWVEAKENYTAFTKALLAELPWRAKYSIYAFSPTPKSPCNKIANSVLLCRTSTGLNITANTTYNANNTIYLQLYFPFSSASIVSSTLEPNDNYTITTQNGTFLSFRLNINSSDEDFAQISTSPAPDLIYLKKAESIRPTQFILENRSLYDSIGPLTLSPPNICSSKAKKLINFGNEVVIADLEIEAW